MEVRRVLVVLCLCVVFASAANKKGKSKPENLEDTYGALVDEDVQNDDIDDEADYGDEVESPPNNEDGDSAAEEHVEFITQPQVFVANVGETLILPCEVSNPEIIMIWQRDDALLFQAGVAIDKFPNIEEFANNTLKVTLQGVKDYGNYACILMTTNDVKNRPKIIHRVVQPSPPSIEMILTNKNNNETVYKPGETLTLTCVASGYPKPTISWHKGNERLHITGDTLQIPNLTVEDDGIYRCLADNQPTNQVPGATHHVPSHRHIQIHVEHVPKIKVKEYLVTSNKEKDAELTCTVDAYPQAKIIWKKGDDNILNEGKNQIKVNRKQNEVESMLLISDLQDEDFTSYTCFARNSLGKTEQKINLVKVPVVRQFVKPEKSNRDVVLTWKVESVSPITAHEIQYRKKGEGEWKAAKPEVTVGDSNIYTVKYTLKDLDAGAYETRVRSMSEHGWSEYSDIMPFEGELAKSGSSTHKNHHKKHHKDQKEPKEKHIASVQGATSVPQQQEIVQKEAPVGASITGGSTVAAASSATSSAAILSIALIFLFSIRQ